MEMVLWLIERVKSGLWGFLLEVSHWMMYCRPTQNIQINKIIGENEKCVFYFMEKKTREVLRQPNITNAQ